MEMLSPHKDEVIIERGETQVTPAVRLCVGGLVYFGESPDKDANEEE